MQFNNFCNAMQSACTIVALVVKKSTNVLAVSMSLYPFPFFFLALPDL